MAESGIWFKTREKPTRNNKSSIFPISLGSLRFLTFTLPHIYRCECLAECFTLLSSYFLYNRFHAYSRTIRTFIYNVFALAYFFLKKKCCLRLAPNKIIYIKYNYTFRQREYAFLSIIKYFTRNDHFISCCNAVFRYIRKHFKPK